MMRVFHLRMKGFALLEVMLALVVLGIVAGAGAKGIGAYQKYHAQKVTQERFDTIAKACAVYLAYGDEKSYNNAFQRPSKTALPSPSDFNAEGALTYRGNVPTEILGLSAEYKKDGWGHPITYITPVVKDGADKYSPLYDHRIAIRQKGSTAPNQPDKYAYLLVLIPHGPTGKGALGENGHVRHMAELTVEESQNMAIDQTNFQETAAHLIRGYQGPFFMSFMPPKNNNAQSGRPFGFSGAAMSSYHQSHTSSHAGAGHTPGTQNTPHTPL